METTPLLSNTSIVIPAYWISAGIVLYTGIQAAVMGFAGHRVRHLSDVRGDVFLCSGLPARSGRLLYRRHRSRSGLGAARAICIYLCLLSRVFCLYRALHRTTANHALVCRRRLVVRRADDRQLRISLQLAVRDLGDGRAATPALGRNAGLFFRHNRSG